MCITHDEAAKNSFSKQQSYLRFSLLPLLLWRFCSPKHIVKFFSFLLRPFHIGPIKKIADVIRSFPITEKLLFFAAVIVFLVSSLILLLGVNASQQVEVPTRGGTIREGIVGTPRFINPILAISDADRDLTALVYAGLTKASSEGAYISDLAESFNISEDGTIYTFHLRDNLRFHDGEALTTEDIEFTIKMAQDILLKSPKRVNWEGVGVKILSDKEIQFILSEPFEPFIENTTLGILPKHIWENITTEQFQFSQFNIDPVGAGPYRVRDVRYNSGGLPIHYDLSPFRHYALGEPFIDRLVIRLYQNNAQLIEAFNSNDIDTINGFSKSEFEQLELQQNDVVLQAPLPRVFGVFFNQNEDPVLLNEEVREALSVATDRSTIVDEVFGEFAEATDSPLPHLDTEVATSSTERAIEILEEAGWTRNEKTGVYERETDDGTDRLAFSISTSNIAELVETASLLESQWEEIGASVEIQVFETNDLNQSVIRPRDYESLLFGLILGRNVDLYPFWHSSGRTDPGLNIAQYTNITVDKVVEDVRVTFDNTQRQDLFSTFIEELEKDIPAVFVYSPYFTYILPGEVQRAPVGNIVLPSDRFNNIHEWYIDTEKVWKIFLD